MQLDDELERVKQEIEQRGNTMADGGKVMEMSLLMFDVPYFNTDE